MRRTVIRSVANYGETLPLVSTVTRISRSPRLAVLRHMPVVGAGWLATGMPAQELII
jgi:hypothetical protein